MDEPGTLHERMVHAAGDLLYAEGITATGVDRISAVLGVSKRTLYRHFGTKDRLVADCLAARDEPVRALLTGHDDALDPPARLLAVFDAASAMLHHPGFRGCPFVNAAGELAADHPARAVAAGHKQALLAWLTTTAAAAGAVDPAALAHQLTALLDGAMAQRAVLGDRSSFAPVADAARVLVAAATGSVPPAAGPLSSPPAPTRPSTAPGA